VTLNRLLLLLFACALSFHADSSIPQALSQSTNREPVKEELGQFINANSPDTSTKLEVMQQEIYRVEQDIMLQEFVQEYGDHIHLKRVLYASDSEMIPGLIFAPLHMAAGKRYAALELLHGGFHGNFDRSFFSYVDAAVARGFVVFVPEYRSSRGYGEENYQSDYGFTDLADVLAGAEFMTHLNYVDGKRLGIIGHSRGGMLTVSAIEKEPTRFTAAVDLLGLVDFLSYMSYKPDYRRIDVSKEPSFGGKLPFENIQPYLDVSPINNVSSIQTPLLIVGTTVDNEVPWKLNGGRLAELMKAEGKVYEMKLYPKTAGLHSFIFGDTPEAQDCLDRSLEFMSKYLKP